MITRKNFLIGAAATAATASAIECESIDGWSGRARGLTGGAFMGTMLAQQGGGSDFDPARTYFVIDVSAGSHASDRQAIASASLGTVIDWGDGTAPTTVDVAGATYRHTYEVGGPYTIDFVGEPESISIYTTGSFSMSKANIGDSVVTLGSASLGTVTGLGSTFDEVLGMRNVESILGILSLPSVKRFSIPPKVETLVINQLTLTNVEEFSLGNVKYFQPNSSQSTTKRWQLGKVARLDFRGITPTGNKMGAVPLIYDSQYLEWVHWGKLKYLVSSGTSGTGSFCNCPKLTQVLRDDDSPFANPSSLVYSVFGLCPQLNHKPIDISDSSSVTSTSANLFHKMYDGDPHLFPDHKATIDVRAFSVDCAANCGITELTLVCGDTPTSAGFGQTEGNLHPGLKKIVIDNVYNISPISIFAGSILETLEEVVFPRHTAFAFAPRFLAYAKNFTHQVVVKYPTHTMDEVKNLVRYNTTTKEFPWGAPADTPVSKMYFQCSDGDMDVAGNVIP